MNIKLACVSFVITTFIIRIMRIIIILTITVITIFIFFIILCVLQVFYINLLMNFIICIAIISLLAYFQRLVINVNFILRVMYCKILLSLLTIFFSISRASKPNWTFCIVSAFTTCCMMHSRLFVVCHINRPCVVYKFVYSTQIIIGR